MTPIKEETIPIDPRIVRNRFGTVLPDPENRRHSAPERSPGGQHMGEGSQRVSVLAAESTPGGKHIKAGSKLYSFKGGQIQPTAQELVQPAVPSFPHGHFQVNKPAAPSHPEGSTDSSLQVIEMIPCPIKREGLPIEVLGERHGLPPTDEEGDTPMSNTPSPTQEPATLPATITPQRKGTGPNTNTEGDTRMEGEKGKQGKPKDLPTPPPRKPTRTTDSEGKKGRLQEGEKYANEHPNAERVWERRNNTRKLGEREGIRENETMQNTVDSGADRHRCKNCGNRHSGAYWPECEECGKRHKPNEYSGRPKYRQYPPPPTTPYGVYDKLHRSICKFKDTERCSTCLGLHYGICRKTNTLTPPTPAQGTSPHATGSNSVPLPQVGKVTQQGERRPEKKEFEITITGPRIWALSECDTRRRAK